MRRLPHARRGTALLSGLSLVATAGLVVRCSGGAGQPAASPCGSCAIVVHARAQLPVDVLPQAVDRDARGRYIAATGSTIRVYSAAGALEERVDHARSGPGDFRGIGDVTAVPGDSLLVVESTGARMAVLAPDRSVARRIRLPAGAQVRSLLVSRWPERLLFSGYALRRSGVFLATFDDDFLVIERALRTRRPPRDRRRPLHRLAASASGVWTAEAHSFTLALWDSTGRQIARTTRRPPWFVVLSGRGRGGSAMPSSIRGMAEDSAGRLWVYALVATELAGPAWRDPEARRAGGALYTSAEELYDTVITVLDPRYWRVLASGRIAGYALAVLDNGDAVIAMRRSGAPPRVVVYRPALREDDP